MYQRTLHSISDISTMDVIMTDTSDQHTHSEQDLYEVADLVLWTSIPTLTAREIAQRKTVCKTWAAWNSEHNHLIAQARGRDVTRDWYFPLLAKNLTNQQLIPPHSWSWTGIWHATADHSSDTVQSLPPLVHQWTRFSRPSSDIIACSGGLLLIKLHTLVHTIYSVGFWQPLLVCNPFTKECRVLPEPGNIAAWSIWFYFGVQSQMVVDDESNAYEVILLFTYCVYVYKSTSNSWTCKAFPQSGPWGNPLADVVPAWNYVCASAWAGGRIYVADVELAGPIVDMPDPRVSQVHVQAGNLRIFEIEVEAGRWTQRRFPLQKWYMNFPHVGNRTSRFRRTLGPLSYEFNTGILRYLNLVVCMGDVYAIIPTRLDEILQDRQGHRPHGDCGSCLQLQRLKYVNKGVELMPLMFHIFQMQQGAIVSHELLRMEIPQAREDIQFRRQYLLQLTSQNYQPSKNWFSCTAVGSVLWVAVEQDYVLQYDVVSRESRTHIITVNRDDDHLGFAYRPSFHVKP